MCLNDAPVGMYGPAWVYACMEVGVGVTDAFEKREVEMHAAHVYQELHSNEGI